MRILLLSMIFWSSTLWADELIIRKQQPPLGDNNATGFIGIGRKGISEGGAFYVRLLENGFITPINDSVGVEGMFILSQGVGDYNKSGTGYAFSGGMRWDFHLTQKWSFFVMPQYAIIKREDSNTKIAFAMGVGGMYHLNHQYAVRVFLVDSLGAHFLGGVLKF